MILPARFPALAGGRPALAVLAIRLRSLRNRLRDHATRRRRRMAIQTAMLLVGGFWLVGLVAAATYGATRFAAGPDEAADILAAFFALVAVGGFIGAAAAALHAFYFASDLPFLLSLPLSLRVTFAAKFVDAMLGSGLIAAVLVATLVGYGLARGERWWWPAIAAVVGLLLLASTTAVATLVVTALGRLLPPRRAGVVLGALSLVLVVLLWIAYSAVAPDIAPGGANGPAPNSLGASFAAAGERVAWTPLAWAAAAVVAAAEGSVPRMIVQLALATAATVALVGTSFAVFATTFARAHGGYRMVTFALRRPDRPLARWVATALAPLPRPIAALVVKEWLTMFRDLRRLSGAVWPLGMVAIYALVLSRRDATAPAGAPGLAFWLGCGSLALVPWGASLGISIYAFGTERRQIHLLRSLPLSPRTLLLAKCLANLAPVLLLAQAATVLIATAQEATPGQYFGLAALVAWAATGYVLIDTAAAAIAPNFAADQVQRATALTGRIVGFVAGTVFTVASGAAATRLIFYATGIPDNLRPVLAWKVFGIEPLGWPLVTLAAGLALLDVAVCVALAAGRVAAIVRDGD